VLRPKRAAVPMLVFAFVWKVGTEAFRQFAGEPIWEFSALGASGAASHSESTSQSSAPQPSLAPSGYVKDVTEISLSSMSLRYCPEI
jgi:hypothetical protein